MARVPLPTTGLLRAGKKRRREVEAEACRKRREVEAMADGGSKLVISFVRGRARSGPPPRRGERGPQRGATARALRRRGSGNKLEGDARRRSCGVGVEAVSSRAARTSCGVGAVVSSS
ncbi:hypothetical protein PR202_ga24181 [Eleusine coracana subsp. coracana]|uniref:Uncharacterized protein n=1 Tax=Eleusine coracana subsp. coracana TaxID=191504 RepID=A0AAV5D771_ELECO|nr:hypothetical protein PR202_ga24181 [Eleusine coracana subsp. coracana]